MNWGNILWWALALIIAVALQGFLPGVDFLLPLFILCLQERHPAQVAWVTALLILIQEGTGTMHFGSTLIWYAMAVGLFYLGHWLFEVENFLFIFLLSGCLGATHFIVFVFMNGLENVPVDRQLLLDESVYQALFTPFLWRLAWFTRQFVPKREDTA